MYFVEDELSDRSATSSYNFALNDLVVQIFLRNVHEVMLSKSSKFGGIIFLCHQVITIRVFVLTYIVEFRLK